MFTPPPPPVLFIDFEAFQHGDEGFNIKELCVLDMRAPMRPLNFLFKPTTRWRQLTREQQRTYLYQEHRLHHIHWKAGNERYCPQCVQRQIKELLPSATEQSIFYVIGEQKAAYLANEFRDLNIVTYKHTYKELPHAPSHIVCMNHYYGVSEHCALFKCYRMYLHYLKL